METSGEPLRENSALIVQKLSLGWLYIQSVKNLNLGLQSEKLYCAYHFFQAAYQAGADQAITIAEGLVAHEPAGDGASLWRIFTGDGFASQQASLRAVQERIRQVRQEREQAMRSFQFDPDNPALGLASFPVEQVAQVEACYRDLFQLMAGQMGDISPKDIEDYVQDDVHFISELMGGGCL